MKRSMKKLRSRRGVSLTEVLAAVLILSLVTLGVAVGVNSAMSAYRRSVTLSDAQTLSSTLATALMDELRFARNVDAGAGTFTSSSFGEGASVGTDAAGQPGHVTVGGQLLVGKGAYAGHLKATADVLYDPGSGTFSVTLKIYDGTGSTAIRTERFSVVNLQKK